MRRKYTNDKKKFTRFSFLRTAFFNLVKKIFNISQACDILFNNRTKKADSIIFLYNGLLQREPEPGAVEYWLDYIDKGHTLDDILRSFIESEEFLSVKATNISKLYVPPGHFYSPIVNVDQVIKLYENEKFIDELPGIKIDKSMMLDLWKELKPYIQSTPFPEKKINSYRYYFLNPAFSYADGIILSAMLRHFKPKKIIEIGSGYSSACTLDTIDKYLSPEVNVTFIEPYPDLLNKLVGQKKLANIKLVENRIQQVDFSMFSLLEENDLLFIDSTHLIKTGSDVCCELFEILPILESGVLIHFHDVFWPFEYPKDWVLTENRSWNEIYGLRAFLMNNSDYEIIFFNDYFCKYFRQIAEKDYPKILKNTGGSLWLRKRKSRNEIL